ncbi:MAG: hypothetical protein NTV23_08340 [Propionibacteriales bacterium]|nr:hypothetical protein [Propionibacteriales bacterium]
MRVIVVAAALALSSACGTQQAAVPSVGLTRICPEVHQALDGLVVSNVESQAAFVVELERITAAGDQESRDAVAPLLQAARDLREAGRGPAYGSALRGVHPASVTVDQACVRSGSPILHSGH